MAGIFFIIPLDADGSSSCSHHAERVENEKLGCGYDVLRKRRRQVTGEKSAKPPTRLNSIRRFSCGAGT